MSPSRCEASRKSTQRSSPKTTVIPGPGTAPYRLRHGERLVHNIDLGSEEPYRAGDPQRRALVDIGGARTALQVALRKEDAVLGVITIYRQEVRPFSDRQIALVQNFAAQAVIAIENTRLLNELRQRTDDLSEALEQQTASAEVLSVISSSPGDLEPVFQAMLTNAVRICDANFGNMFLRDGEVFCLFAAYNTPPPLVEARKRAPLRGRNSIFGRMVQTRRFVHIVDLAAEQDYLDRDPEAVTGVEVGRIRTILFVPLLKDDELIGAIVIYRQEVRPFTDKQVELVQNFAAQAVIAIENTRLLNELREFAAAADRHGRRAQGHQSLDLRSAGGVGHAGEISRTAMRGGDGDDQSSERRGPAPGRRLRLFDRTQGVYGPAPCATGPGLAGWSCPVRG